jgi:pyruvate/2-oxoglutarate dehydrogenase complex dihydrolipoamide acyltransferase (E2) component
MSIVIKVPSLPQNLTEVRVERLHCQVGDMVPRDEVLVELSAGGKLLTICAPQAGVIERIFFSEGQNAAAGAVIIHLKSGLPNLKWDSEAGTLILDTYHAVGVTTSMEYDLRQMRRQGQQKFGKGVGNTLALPQIENTQQPELGMGAEFETRRRFKVHPKLDSSQFSGPPNPRNTTIPSSAEAQKAPQNAPTLNPRPQAGLGAPTPKPLR